MQQNEQWLCFQLQFHGQSKTILFRLCHLKVFFHYPTSHKQGRGQYTSCTLLYDHTKASHFQVFIGSSELQSHSYLQPPRCDQNPTGYLFSFFHNTHWSRKSVFVASGIRTQSRVGHHPDPSYQLLLLSIKDSPPTFECYNYEGTQHFLLIKDIRTVLVRLSADECFVIILTYFKTSNACKRKLINTFFG